METFTSLINRNNCFPLKPSKLNLKFISKKHVLHYIIYIYIQFDPFHARDKSVSTTMIEGAREISRNLRWERAQGWVGCTQELFCSFLYRSLIMLPFIRLARIPDFSPRSATVLEYSQISTLEEQNEKWPSFEHTWVSTLFRDLCFEKMISRVLRKFFTRQWTIEYITRRYSVIVILDLKSFSDIWNESSFSLYKIIGYSENIYIHIIFVYNFYFTSKYLGRKKAIGF